MFLAGMKIYADGSTQGFTGDMSSPVHYLQLRKAFTDPNIFPQPYDGLPDYDQTGVTQAAKLAHGAPTPLPVWVHSNGNQAQTNVVNALLAARNGSVRDVVVHFALPTLKQVSEAASNNIGATFLVNDFYYYYQPLCEQVLGTTYTANVYPTKWASEAKLHYGLHSDASVTPPTPLFGIWLASGRSYQQASWLPQLSTACAGALTTAVSQSDSRYEAIAAYTSEAAWLYNRETTIGRLKTGYNGDLVILSADPFAQNADLSKIFVLYSVHNGNIVYPVSDETYPPPPATSGPIWPK
jgi:hypothetical protein